MKAIPPVMGATKRILYIEENEDCREVLAAVLGYAGYRVAAACTMAEGLSLARHERFDLYILESNYPDGSGVELCRHIRAFDPDTPIMFYSSAAYARDVKAGMDAGAQEYLSKPTGICTIEGVIVELLAPSDKRSRL